MLRVKISSYAMTYKLSLYTAKVKKILQTTKFLYEKKHKKRHHTAFTLLCDASLYLSLGDFTPQQQPGQRLTDDDYQQVTELL